jgi:ABC-type multidrug transport system ATPase subunit
MPKRLIAPRASELLEQFDLAHAGDRPARTYSGGMRRRLDLAAALVHRPPVLFLDEPTTGLDPQSRSDLWGVIGGLVTEGTTVLLTTQYLEEADRLADDIVVIDHGVVIAAGTPGELKSRLGATVVDLGFADPGSARRGAAALASYAVREPEIDGSSTRFEICEGPRVIVEALRTLDGEGLTPERLEVREPSLDDVFLALTGRRAEPEEEPEPDVSTRGAA